MIRGVALMLVLGLAGSAPAVRGAALTAAELSAAIQKKYEGIRDFRADFVQTYRGGALRRSVTERGRMTIKKPGRMHWEYTAPDRKEFVSDGAKMYFYVPADKQVIVSSLPAEDLATTPALFLAGRGNVVRDFRPMLVDVPEGFPADSLALKLEPTTPQQDYDWLTLVVAPDTLSLRGLVTSDIQGGISTFTFTNLKENVGVADSEFVFRIPRGVDVVTDSSSR
jgi:outer membrane lipoprotein carrier protein